MAFVLILLAAISIAPGGAFAQDNPYGEIDTSKSSLSLLQSSVGTKGNPLELATFQRLDPAEADRLFEVLLDFSAARSVVA